jgi:H+/gluconate symporter-like permease
LTSAGLRAAQGSATVAIVTAAGILAPLMKQLHGYSPEILVLAICCGGTTISHVNDAGFRLVKEYLGMSVAQTLRCWTAMKVLMGLIGLVIVLFAKPSSGSGQYLLMPIPTNMVQECNYRGGSPGCYRPGSPYQP